MSNQDKIKDKIKKLLRLSRSCNENEAKAAMAKAQELMMQYKLNMADVSEMDMEVKELGTGIFYSRQKDFWRAALIEAISKYYCVEHYINRAYRSSRCQICLIGTETDMQVCLDVFNFASQYIEEWFKKFKASEGWKYSIQYLNATKNTYGCGFAKGIEEVLKYQTEQKQQEWGLVMVTPKAAQDFVNGLDKHTSRAKPNDSGDIHISLQGYNAGKNVRLNDKLKGGPK